MGLPDWGDVAVPASRFAPSAIGGAAKGCLAGGVALPLQGDGWQVMRPARNRFYGHPELVAYLEKLGPTARAVGWSGLLVGDMAQPRGGPMRTGHRSHQSGLDADIWFLPAPPALLGAQAREDMAAVSMVAADGLGVDPSRWTPTHAALLRQAAAFPEVDRIFVNAAIKKELCATTPPGERAWLRRIRPWWGHDHHFHVRLACPAGDPACVETEPIPPGDGCDASLDWWLSPEAKAELAKKSQQPARPITLDDLPPACRDVLRGG